MTRKVTIKGVLAFILVLLFAALVIAVAREAVVASQVSSVAAFHELQGIQGADTTQNVAQQKKAKKSGKVAEAKELDEIRRQKVALFKVIATAQETQRLYYQANEKGQDASNLRGELEKQIPEARSALETLKALTDKEVALLQAIGGDESAIYVAKSFYTAMETTVKSLQLEELDESQMALLEKNIRVEGQNAIATAHHMARKLETNELDSDEKDTLDKEVVVPGEKAVKGLGDVLSNLPQIIWASLQGLSESTNLVNRAMDRYGSSQNGLEQMMHDLTYNQGMFNRKNMSQHQQRMDAIGAGVHQFLGTYSPFIKTVGERIGKSTDTDAMGYGDDIIIRFADSKGRLYIVEEDDNMRVIVDKMLTRWDSDEHEVRTMVIYEYNDMGVERVVEDFKRFASDAERYVREARIIYIHKGYRPGIWKSFLYEINFQDENGRQLYHYSSQQVPAGEYIHRKSWDSKILETVMVISPPKYKGASMRKPGETDLSQKKTKKSERPAHKETPPKASGSPKSEIHPPSEGEEFLDTLPVDAATVEAIKEEHRRGIESFNAKKYDLAVRQFGRAAKMSDANHLDAYWAALAAHHAKNRSAAEEWLKHCLVSKSDYPPALAMKKALKLK